MPTELTVYTLTNADQWTAALQKMARGRTDIYFTPAYYASWQHSTAGQAICLHARIGDSDILYPFFKSEIPGMTGYFDIASAYGYGGAISNRPFDETTRQTFDTLVAEWCREEGVIAEFIREYPGMELRIAPEDGRRLVRYNLLVDSHRPIEEIWHRLPGRTRRDIRRPINKGLTVQLDPSLATIDEFHELYRRMAERAGFSAFYRFEWTYFKDILTHLSDNTLIINVRHDGKLAAAALCFHWENILTYHLGASDRRWSTFQPSDLVCWTMIEEAHRRHCHCLRLGGGLGTDPADSLFRFKAKFASSQVPVYISTFVHNREIYEHLCHQWQKANPGLVGSKGHYFLKYRETDPRCERSS